LVIVERGENCGSSVKGRKNEENEAVTRGMDLSLWSVVTKIL